MQKIQRISAGVRFESDVLAFVDRVAAEQQRTRSYVINAMIRWYAKQLHEQQAMVEPVPVEPVIRL